MKDKNDTIVALSTPPGRGALAIIRISGDKCRDIYRSLTKKEPVERRASVVTTDTGRTQDKIIATFFRAPASFTGEDVLELHHHGSQAIVSDVIGFCLENGCRLAEGGEFTRRAFENGKIDLTQAEGVVDLIDSRSAAAARQAYSQSEGGLKSKIDAFCAEIMEVLAQSDAAIDYPDEVDGEELEIEKEKIRKTAEKLKAVINDYDDGMTVKNGLKVAIIGEPNAGKSSMLNALLCADRAIVSSVPGTTRDVVKESFVYKDMEFVLSDTAGLRECTDEIEGEGVKRAYLEAETADVILELSESGGFSFDAKGKPIIRAVSKSDLKPEKDRDTAKFYVSAKSGEGLKELKDKLYELSPCRKTELSAITNLRQRDAARHAYESVENALAAPTEELFATELSLALNCLYEITGKIVSEEVINEIFSRFCVGK